MKLLSVIITPLLAIDTTFAFSIGATPSHLRVHTSGANRGNYYSLLSQERRRSRIDSKKSLPLEKPLSSSTLSLQIFSRFFSGENKPVPLRELTIKPSKLVPLKEPTIEPSRKSNFGILLQWSIFASFITGISFLLHTAGVYSFLDIDHEVWDYLSIIFPSATAFGSIYNLIIYTFMGNGGERLVEMMNGSICEDKRLNATLEEVYEKSGLSFETPPALYIIPTSEPNAFAAGGYGGKDSSSIVAVTTSLLDRLSPAEVRAVIAHELGHLRNGDTIKTVHLASMVAALGFALDLGLRLFLNPGNSDNDDEEEGDIGSMVGGLLIVVGALSYIGTNLLRLAASRSVEYDADAFASSIGVGNDLASALEKIDKGYNGKRESGSKLGVASGAFAHSYISNPPSRENPWQNCFGLLRTHPTTDQRVARLLDKEE